MKTLRLIHGVKTKAVFTPRVVCKIKNVDKSVGFHKMIQLRFFGEQTLYSSDFLNAKENLIKNTNERDA